MDKIQANSTVKTPRFRSWKRLGVIAGIIIAIPLLLFFTADYYARQSFNLVQQEIEKVQKDVMSPAGAIPRAPAYYRGGGLLEDIACGPDVNCPSGTRVWFVPIESGRIGEFTSNVLQAEGYKLRDLSDGSKGKLRMVLTTDPIGSTTPPSAAPVGKEWQFVTVDVYHY